MTKGKTEALVNNHTHLWFQALPRDENEVSTTLIIPTLPGKPFKQSQPKISIVKADKNSERSTN